MSTEKVTLGGNERTLPPVTGRKMAMLGRIVRDITKQAPDLLTELGEFNKTYEREHVVELSRTQALMRYAPQPMVTITIDPETREEKLDPVLKDGEPVMQPGRLDHLTEEDWQASGNRIAFPEEPSLFEQIAAVFPTAFDAAEAELVQLIGLMVVDNHELNDAAREGSARDKVKEEGEKLLDEFEFDDLLELLVVAFETIQNSYARKAEKLGDRLGKLWMMLGIRGLPTSEPSESSSSSSEQSSTTSPTSSTDSDPPTAGPPTTPSTESPGISSTPALTE